MMFPAAMTVPMIEETVNIVSVNGKLYKSLPVLNSGLKSVSAQCAKNKNIE